MWVSRLFRHGSFGFLLFGSLWVSRLFRHSLLRRPFKKLVAELDVSRDAVVQAPLEPSARANALAVGGGRVKCQNRVKPVLTPNFKKPANKELQQSVAPH